MANNSISMPYPLTSPGIVLVVEDRMTEVYLRRILAGAVSEFVTAGGHGSVTALVRDLRVQDDGRNRVFGFCDRDFDSPNVTTWDMVPKGPPFVFRPQRMEIENYLLDELAMCEAAKLLGAPHLKTADEIKSLLLSEAKRQRFWIACRMVMADIHETTLKDFPKTPSMDSITTMQLAVDYIKKSTWSENVTSNLNVSLDVAAIQNGVNAFSEVYDKSLRDGTWTENSSGKEIYKTVCQVMFDDYRHRQYDFAVAIAEYQLASGTVPQDLSSLRDVLNRQLRISQS